LILSQTRRNDGTFGGLTVLSFVLGAALGAAAWLIIPALTGKKEAWDSFWLYHLTMLLGGFLLGLMCRHRFFWVPVVGIYIGQVLFLLVVVNSPWFNAVVFVGLAGVPPALGGAALSFAIFRTPFLTLELVIACAILLVFGPFWLSLLLIVTLVVRHLRSSGKREP
jgi:hypothetical protein